MRPLTLAVAALLLWTLPARAEAPEAPPDVPMGTGRLFLGFNAGLNLPFSGRDVRPSYGVEVAVPIGRAGPALGLEWLLRVDHPTYRGMDGTGYDSVVGSAYATDGYKFLVVAVPGVRALLPVRRRFLLHADASLGLALEREFFAYRFDSGLRREQQSNTWWPAYRLAVGAIIPYSERVRFVFTPFALQNYTNLLRGKVASVQLGLQYGLD